MHGAILQTGRVTLKGLQYVGFWSEKHSQKPYYGGEGVGLVLHCRRGEGRGARDLHWGGGRGGRSRVSALGRGQGICTGEEAGEEGAGDLY